MPSPVSPMRSLPAADLNWITLLRPLVVSNRFVWGHNMIRTDPSLPRGEDAVIAWRTLPSGKIYIDTVVKAGQSGIEHRMAKIVFRYMRVNKITSLDDHVDVINRLYDRLREKYRALWRYYPYSSKYVLSRLCITNVILFFLRNPSCCHVSNISIGHIVFIRGRFKHVSPGTYKRLVALYKIAEKIPT